MDFNSLDDGFNPYTTENEIYHVVFRTDNCLDINKFISHWNIFNNITAQCSDHNCYPATFDEKPKTIKFPYPHMHLIGSIKSPICYIDGRYNIVTNDQRFAPLFSDPNSYAGYRLLYGIKNYQYHNMTDYNIRMGHYKLLQCIFKIQTADSKFNHTNCNVFTDHTTYKNYLYKFYKDYFWFAKGRNTQLNNVKLFHENKEHIIEELNYLKSMHDNINKKYNKATLQSESHCNFINRERF